MKRVVVALTALGIIGFGAKPVAAQATRVFVSAHGVDTNACSFSAPCRSFQHAHDVVAANGEIDVLDPAGYGPVNINKAISIQGHGFAGVGANDFSGGNGINVNAGASDIVNLRGLLIDGQHVENSGVDYKTGILNLQDCVIRSFAVSGVSIEGPNAYLSNSIVSDSTVGGVAPSPGILIDPTQTTHVTLSRMELVGNMNGIEINGNFLANSAVVWVSVNDSVMAGNRFQGIFAHNLQNPNPHSFITAMVTRSSIVDGPGTGIILQGTGVLVELNQSTIANNAGGWSTASGAVVASYGNNVLSDFASAGDGAPTPSALK